MIQRLINNWNILNITQNLEATFVTQNLYSQNNFSQGFNIIQWVAIESAKNIVTNFIWSLEVFSF